MATETISGTNKLAERIVAEAELEAGGVRDDAQKSAHAIREASQKALDEKRYELSQRRETTAAGIRDGCRTRASLDARKAALRKKRVVIDAAFARAYQEMLSLSEAERKGICERMLRSESEAGEQIVPAAADRGAIAALMAEGKTSGLTLSERDAKIDGGFLLIGSGYEKDCSFHSLLSELRDHEETNVAKLLFD